MSALVEVRDLVKVYQAGGGIFAKGPMVRAVDGVSFDIREGETFGLVGESGCGKTTLGRLILRLLHPTSGVVRFRGTDIASLSESEMRDIRPQIQVVLQNPFGALDPRMRVFDLVAQPMRIHDRGTPAEVKSRVSELLHQVGLGDVHLRRYPHELSGGQCQRVALARALGLEPTLLVLDEPTSALDVSVQAQILRLLEELRETRNLTYLFVSHDLSVVRYMSDTVGVMYLGRMVEQGPGHRIFSSPAHHYTRALLASAPEPDFGERMTISLLPGMVPSATSPPPGCRFHPRCAGATEVCRVVPPGTVDIGDEHYVSCHHPLVRAPGMGEEA